MTGHRISLQRSKRTRRGNGWVLLHCARRTMASFLLLCTESYCRSDGGQKDSSCKVNREPYRDT